MVGFDLNRLNTDGEWQQRTFIQPIGEISEIYINSRNVRVEVRPTRGNEIVITYFENEHTTFTESIASHRVSLAQDRSQRFNTFSIGFNINVGNRGIVVEVPENAILSGEFRTTNGRIEIRELNFETLQVRSTNGMIRLEEVAVEGEAVVNTTNAQIHLADSDFSEQVSLTTTNGRISLERVDLSKNINMNTSSGAVNLSEVHSTGNIHVSTTNGRIEVGNVITTGDLDFSSSNAMITLDRTVFNNGNLTTTNGRVIVNDLQRHEEYRFVTRTSNGRIIIGDLRLEGGSNNFGGGQRLLNIRTSNGNIEVSFD